MRAETHALSPIPTPKNPNPISPLPKKHPQLIHPLAAHGILYAMDTAPQPTDDTEALDELDTLLERARLFILDLMIFVDGIFERLGSVPLSAKLARRLTRHALLPAETALRRAILILAAGLPMPVLRAPRAAPDTAPPRASTVSPQATKPRPPAFRMSEPPPRARNDDTTRPDTAYLPEDQLPRILALTDAVLYAPPAPPKPLPGPRDPTAIFCRRYAALQAAFHDAQGEARRWARRRARAMARAGAGTRALPLPLALPRPRKSAKPTETNLLRDLTDSTNTCFGHNTS
ncbi:hypothetical protein HNE_1055 [Hyphomonas neptunium ATCC 15444]|uniref:Uncharacterized protein n=2 Tax=Hyphomonas TaxID=85 RepID=Q0C3B6_HYPNA|nr:hypothetical protein HNE_1055 [Hyphomonas neptunium ATCC 15444]